jgi:hypothetical protein
MQSKLLKIKIKAYNDKNKIKKNIAPLLVTQPFKKKYFIALQRVVQPFKVYYFLVFF